MDHFFTRNSMGRVFGFLEVSSVRKNWKIYPNFKIPEIFGFLDLGLSLEPDTWLYLFGHGISQTQPMWGHTQNFSSFGPLILHLPGGGWISPPPSLKCVAGTPSLLGLNDLVQFITVKTARDLCWKIFWLCCECMTPTSHYIWMQIVVNGDSPRYKLSGDRRYHPPPSQHHYGRVQSQLLSFLTRIPPCLCL